MFAANKKGNPWATEVGTHFADGQVRQRFRCVDQPLLAVSWQNGTGSMRRDVSKTCRAMKQDTMAMGQSHPSEQQSRL